MRVLIVRPKTHFLQIEDDVGHVLGDPGHGGEFMEDALDSDGHNARSHERGEQNAPHGIADCLPETALERLGIKFSIRRRQG
jgi:hypothetical protein